VPLCGHRCLVSLAELPTDSFVSFLEAGYLDWTSRGPLLSPEDELLIRIPVHALQKTATAVAHVKRGKGLIKLNGSPIELAQPEILRYKVYEPIFLIGKDKVANVDIRIRVKGGGHTSQIYGAFASTHLDVRDMC